MCGRVEASEGSGCMVVTGPAELDWYISFSQSQQFSEMFRGNSWRGSLYHSSSYSKLDPWKLSESNSAFRSQPPEVLCLVHECYDAGVNS